MVTNVEKVIGRNEVEGRPTAAEVFRLHARDVERWASRLGGPGLELEDVVQQVFLKVHQHVGGWTAGSGQLTTWLYRITENEVRHRRRKNKLRLWLGGTPEETAGGVPAPGPNADQELERHQGRQRFYRVLDSMKERHRTVLVLFELEAMSGEEIATLLGAKSATVWVWLHRARAEFLSRMERIIREEGL